MANKKSNKKGLRILGVTIVVGILAVGIIVGLPSMTFNDGTWYGFLGTADEGEVIPETPTIYNEQDAWTNINIKVGIKNGYTYNLPAINGIAVSVRTVDTNIYVDGGTTGTDGTWTSTVESFNSGETYKLIVGSITTTNKSQEFSFVVQGQDGDSKPTYIHCGTFEYLPVTEESGIAFAWYDENYASLSEANFTSTYTDKIVDGFIKVTFSASSTGFGRDLVSNTKGTVKAYLAFIVTDSTLVTSSAVRADGTPNYLGMGGGTGKAVFVISMLEMSYEVDEDGYVKMGKDAVQWVRFRLDFTGCGVTGSNATEFTLAGVVSYEYDWTLFAAGGSPWDSTNVFGDTDLSAINCTV